MSSDTLFGEQETISPSGGRDRGGDEEQVVRKLIAGGLLRLGACVVCFSPVSSASGTRKRMRTRAAKRRRAAVRINGWHAS